MCPVLPQDPPSTTTKLGQSQRKIREKKDGEEREGEMREGEEVRMDREALETHEGKG